MNDDADLAHRRRVASYRRQTRQAAAKPNQIVPENTIAGNALTIVIAIMSFLACLTLGAVTLVRDASRDWQLDVQREITIQVRPVEGVDTDEAAALAASIARQTQGVAGVEVLNASENASLLEPWLGAGLDTTDLPIPRLVVVRLTEPDAFPIAYADYFDHDLEGLPCVGGGRAEGLLIPFPPPGLAEDPRL